MESVILFYDNVLIYSPNEFFISLAFLVSFIILLIVNVFYFFVESIRYATKYVVEIHKKRNKVTSDLIRLRIKTPDKKIKHNLTRLLIKTVGIVLYMIINKKTMKIIINSRKILNALKEEVLIKEGEQT